MTHPAEHLARTVATDADTGQVEPNAQWRALMTADSGPLAFTRGYMLGVSAVPAPEEEK